MKSAKSIFFLKSVRCVLDPKGVIDEKLVAVFPTWKTRYFNPPDAV